MLCCQGDFCETVLFLASPIQLKSPFIEHYLKYVASLQADNSTIFNLLWRYYEKNKDYLPAAKILDYLAHQERCFPSCPPSSPVRNFIILLFFCLVEFQQKKDDAINFWTEAIVRKEFYTIFLGVLVYLYKITIPCQLRPSSIGVW